MHLNKVYGRINTAVLWHGLRMHDMCEVNNIYEEVQEYKSTIEGVVGFMNDVCYRAVVKFVFVY